MVKFGALEVVFGIIDILSALFCGLALLFIYRKTGFGGMKGMSEVDKLMFKILKVLYWANLFYHISLVSAYYPDMLLFDGNWTNWAADQVYAWPQLIIYITLSTFVYCSAFWLILFWSKLKTVHFLTPLNFLLDLASRTELLQKIWIALISLNFMGHIVIVITAGLLPRGPDANPQPPYPAGYDGRKMLLMCNVPMVVSLVFLVLINLPLTSKSCHENMYIFLKSIVDLIGIIAVASKSKVSKGKNEIISIAVKIIIITVFSSLAALMAISNGSQEFFSTIARIAGSISPVEENKDLRAYEIRKTVGISMSRFIYAFCGMITSLPYLVRKDFYRIAFKGDNSNSTASQSSKQIASASGKFKQNASANMSNVPVPLTPQ